MKKVLLTSLVSAGMATSAFAAQDGDLGSSSSGSLDVTLKVPSLIKLSGLDDISLNLQAGENSLTGNSGHTNFCVYANNASGDFDITTTGSGASNAYTLTDGTDLIAYQVGFAGTSVDSDDPTNATTQLPTNTATGVSGAANTLAAYNCGAGAETSTLWVTVPETELAGKTIGDYTGTLNVTVAAK